MSFPRDKEGKLTTNLMPVFKTQLPWTVPTIDLSPCYFDAYWIRPLYFILPYIFVTVFETHTRRWREERPVCLSVCVRVFTGVLLSDSVLSFTQIWCYWESLRLCKWRKEKIRIHRRKSRTCPLLKYPNFYYLLHNNLPFVSILSHTYPVHVLPPYLFTIHFNNILEFMYKFSCGLFLQVFVSKFSMNFFFLSPSQLSHPNDIWFGVKIRESSH